MNDTVLLIDVDSKMPNLAFMKISAYHKSIDDDVSFNNTYDPDIVYASVVFKKNKHLVDGLKFYYPDSKIIIGGSGYDIKIELPAEIENIKPDYSLYDMDYSLGYASRGCNRNCSFCIVPQKEGKFCRAQHPEKWFSIFFAWDNINDEKVIREKIELLKSAGINIRSDVIFYVYLDGIYDYDSAVYRCRTLKSLNTNPFVMFNIDEKPNKTVNSLRRWANRKWAFWSCDINEYTRKGAKYTTN